MISDRSIAQKVQEFRQNITPAVRCYHPIRIYNSAVGAFDYVNCGKCPYCQKVKLSTLAARCEREMKYHRFSVFFTLTYDNEHIPYIERVSDSFMVVRNRQYKVDEVSSAIYPTKDFDVTQKIETSDGSVDIDAYSVLYKKDIQDFLKRLRVTISRKLNKYYPYRNDHEHPELVKKYREVETSLSLRYFICGEYGPTTNRAHYHGILWLDNKELFHLLFDPYRGTDNDSTKWHGFIYKAWKMCSPERCDVQCVTSSASQYVSSYVNSTVSKSHFLSSKPFRPFYLASKNPIIGSYKVDDDLLSDMLFNGTCTYRSFDENTKSFVDLPIPYENFLSRFPKCTEFSVSSTLDKLRLYQKYLEHRYIKRGVHPRSLYDSLKRDLVSVDDNCRYLDKPWNNYFRYQNKRFFKVVRFWSDSVRSYPLRDINGELTGEYINVKLSAYEVIEKFEKLYSNLALLKLRNFYLEQDILMQSSSNLFPSVYYGRVYLLTYYPEFFKHLPFILTTNVDKVKLDSQLQNFGLRLYDLYFANRLNVDLISSVENHSIISNYRFNTFHKLTEKSKTKKFKEYYARQKGIIY